MIDNIVMMKKNLSDAEILQVVKKSRLLEQSVNGLTAYDNTRTKNFDGGFYITIDPAKTLKIAGSLHKYYSFLHSKSLTNFDLFTMDQARITAMQMINNIGFNPVDTNITLFEIGINVVVCIDPKEIFKNVSTIGTLETAKEMLYNPKYKDKRMITTVFHRDYRVYHKMYDKVFEMHDKRKAPPASRQIVRIETVHRRVENITLIDFFNSENLTSVKTRFFKNWDKLNFFSDIEAPQGTHKSKRELAKEIIYKGKFEVLKHYQLQYKNGVLSAKMYYNIKKFIDNWEVEKFKYGLKKTQIFAIWESLYVIEKQQYN